MPRPENTTITIRREVMEKLREYKEVNNIPSFNKTIISLLPRGNVEKIDFEREAPAFTLIGENKTPQADDVKIDVSWNTLKKSYVGNQWEARGNINVETATVVFKNEDGVSVLFKSINVNEDSLRYNNVYESMNFYHFLE